MLGCVGSVLGEIVLASCQIREPQGMVSHFLLNLSCKSSDAVAPTGANGSEERAAYI
jgi:hypothetical protein